MGKTIQVTYSGEIDRFIDILIIKTLEAGGFAWYTQSSDEKTKKRTLNFEYRGKNES